MSIGGVSCYFKYRLSTYSIYLIPSDIAPLCMNIAIQQHIIDMLHIQGYWIEYFCILKNFFCSIQM